MTISINHPQQFKMGVRLIMKILRKKDGGPTATDRATRRYVTTEPKMFDLRLESLKSTLLPSERIYASASPRDLKKAIRMFRMKQIESESEQFPFDFYLNIENRWLSCLASPEATSKEGKVWLLDLDDQEIADSIIKQACFAGAEIFDDYQTVNGRHVIVKPFNTSCLLKEVNDVIKKEALMLWAFDEVKE